MSESLPERPNLEQLKKQAKDLLQRARAGQPAAFELFREPGEPALHEAQKCVARRYGFPTWSQLKAEVERRHRLAVPFEALAAAVQADDVPGALAQLAAHPELRAKLNEPLPGAAFGATALVVAIRRICPPMIEALVASGSNPNQRTHWWAGGFTALEDCDPSLLTLLISLGAEIDIFAASRHGLIPELKARIAEDRRRIHARGGDGKTPLHWAKNVEVAKILVDAGAMIDARDIDHESTPAQYLLESEPEVARYLVSQGCHTDLLMAAALGDLELARRQLQTDPGCIRLSVSEEFFPMKNPKAGGIIYIWVLGHHTTPHELAKRHGHQELLDYLMEASPEVVQLSRACETQDEALLARCAGKQAAPTLASDRARLVDAAQRNQPRMLALLLEHGWPPDCRNNHGATALHWACWHGNAQAVQRLLDARAPLEAREDGFGRTPLGWATHGSLNSWFRKTGDYPEVIRLLRAAGARVSLGAEERESLSEPLRTALGG